jgi:hypothetical protein
MLSPDKKEHRKRSGRHDKTHGTLQSAYKWVTGATQQEMRGGALRARFLAALFGIASRLSPFTFRA